MPKIVFIIISVVILTACGEERGRSGVRVNTDSSAKEPDPAQVLYIKNVLASGPKLFKQNCAICHSRQGVTCRTEFFAPDLKYTFSSLPMDSLPYYQSYVKNSQTAERIVSRNPFVPSQNKDSLYHHNFGETLSDSLLKTVVEYIWITYRPTKES